MDSIKIESLKCAVMFYANKQPSFSDVIKLAKKFEEYLNSSDDEPLKDNDSILLWEHEKKEQEKKRKNKS